MILVLVLVRMVVIFPFLCFRSKVHFLFPALEKGRINTGQGDIRDGLASHFIKVLSVIFNTAVSENNLLEAP